MHNAESPFLPAAIQRNVSLQALNTLALPVLADYYLKATTIDDIQQALAFAAQHQLPLQLLGGGSNTVFQPRFPGLVIHIALRGIRVLSEDNRSVLLQVAAGEIWDDFLQYCLAHGYYGLENMAIIPGTVGAAPIQNIGAYGKEVAAYIEQVQALDIASGTLINLSREQCVFSYRDSLFKQQPNRYIVTAVQLRLDKHFVADLSYQALADALQGKTVDAHAVRHAVITLRNSRLPDPAILANAGSFFKNPVVDAAQFARLQAQYAQLPFYPQPDGSVKLPAAWLIEQCGFRGKRFGNVGMYDKQALVLVNYGGAGFADVARLAQSIISSVQQQFAVNLEPEPVFVRL